jgi:hypothetical protein
MATMPSSRSSRASPQERHQLSLALSAAMVVVALLGGCEAGAGVTPPNGTEGPSSGASTTNGGRGTSSGEPGSALAALATLAVKGRAPKTGYDRALFGQSWADVDRNGCDTRNDVLRRDLRPYVLKPGTNGCRVMSGTLHDPYLGRTIAFVRGAGTSAEVQIDHVVPLSDAWQKGAQQWSVQQRTAFANDPLNLLAVDGLTNQRKGDSDAATWLPPNKAYRCTYAARQIAVKARYGSWVTGAERDALGGILATCPSQSLPAAISR